MKNKKYGRNILSQFQRSTTDQQDVSVELSFKH